MVRKVGIVEHSLKFILGNGSFGKPKKLPKSAVLGS